MKVFFMIQLVGRQLQDETTALPRPRDGPELAAEQPRQPPRERQAETRLPRLSPAALVT